MALERNVFISGNPLGLVENIGTEAGSMSAPVQVFGRRDDGLTTRCGGRRPRSAKARIAGVVY
jgi:hypothetical protein